MPKTIRKTLLGRLLGSGKLSELRRDFEVMTGVPLRLVGPYGEGPEASLVCSESELCGRVRSHRAGCAHCHRMVEELVLDSGGRGVRTIECDAGLTEFCVPLRLGMETIGYLIAGGYRTGGLCAVKENRLRHLMGRLGMGGEEEGVLRAYRAHPHVFTEEQGAAMQRWLQLAAEALIRSLELREDTSDRALPAFVIRICAVIQRNYRDPPSMAQAAALCGLSEGYFCRSFHHFTGLRYLEYIQAVRVEHVCELLKNPRNAITEVAFSVGFQSLSQFNRVFRKLMGTSPRNWRKAEGRIPAD